MKNLLIIEPHMNGHHGVYLRWIVRGALERDCRVLIGTFEDSLRHPIFEAIVEKCQGTPEVITLPTLSTDYMSNTGTGGLLRRELAYRKLFKQLYHKMLQRAWPDFVFLPFLDYCTYAIALIGSPFGRTPWGGIVMRPVFHYKEMGLIGPNSCLLRPKEILFLRMLKQKENRALFTIDPSFDRYIKNKGSAGAEKLHYLPNPTEIEGDMTKQEARRALDIPENAVVVLVYGAISLRKGVDVLLTAALEFSSEVHILFAGRQDPEVDCLLQSSMAKHLLISGRLHQMNKFLTDEEEYMAFKASDVAWLGYRNHYTMSGVLVQAGRLGLPVIACKEGLLGWLTQKHKLGVVVDTLDEKVVAEAINRLVSSKANLVCYGEAGKEYFSGHTADRFVTTIFESIS